MREPHLYERVKSIIEATVDARRDETITFSEASRIVGEIIQAATHVAGALQDRQGHYEPLAESCEQLFDEFVAPIDLPAPNLLETAVDRILRSQIRPTLSALFEKMEG